MSASSSPCRPALLAGLVVAGLSISCAALADPEPVHHPLRELARHAHAVLKRPAAHPKRPAHPVPVVRHAPLPTPPAVLAAPAVPGVLIPSPPPKGSSTGLPLPRFAALRADAVNLRSGPGARYPIQWVYKRRDLPVKIEREFDVWRLIEDSDGIKGWVHQATLVGTRSFVILSPAADAAPAAVSAGPAVPDPEPLGSQVLRSAPQPDAAPVAVLEPGVIGRLRACAAGSGWCRVTVKDYAGWLPRQAIWGLLPDETIPAP